MAETPQKLAHELPSACLGVLDDLPSAANRLSSALTACEELRRYRDTLLAVDRLEDRRSCPGLGARLADRAYEAEIAYRVLARDALEAVNLVRDSGNLTRALEQLARRAEGGLGPDEIASLLRDAVEKMGREEKLPRMDPAFVEEAIRTIRDLGFSVSARGKRVTVSVKRRDGGEARREFTIEPGPGTQGRIATGEFFGGPMVTGVASVFGGPLLTQEDCHSRPASITSEVPTDLYGQLVGALATGRELLYRHARKVDEIGHGEIEGEDPVTVVAAVVIAVGAILLVAGVTIGIGCLAGAWSGDVCDYALILIAFGIIFVAGGICVAVGACQFVLALFLIIAA